MSNQFFPRAIYRLAYPLVVLIAVFLLSSLVSDLEFPGESGITCINQRDSLLFLVNRKTRYRYEGDVYTSINGGLDWEYTSSDLDSWRGVHSGRFSCPRQLGLQPFPHPNEPNVFYRYREGQGIDRSDDGMTWFTELDLSGLTSEGRNLYYSRVGKGIANFNVFTGAFNALVHQPTGNLVVAMGHDGLLVRTPDARWHWIEVGPYRYENVYHLSSAIKILAEEIWLGFVLGILSLTTMVQPLGNRVGCMRSVLLRIGWVTWGVSLFIFPTNRIVNTDGSAAWTISVGSILFSTIVIAGVALKNISDLYIERPKGLGQMGAGAILTMLLFLFSYVLWLYGILQDYDTATLLAVVSTISAILVGQYYLRLVFQGKLPVGKRKKVDQDDEI